MAQQLTTDILNAALENLTSNRIRSTNRSRRYGGLLSNGRNGSAATTEPARQKHGISAAGRRAIATAQRRRWAESKAVAGSTPAAEAKKPKRKLSAAGAAIVPALKKRWAAKRAQAAKAGNVQGRSTRGKAA